MKPEIETRQMLDNMNGNMIDLLKSDPDNQLQVVTGFIEGLKWVLEVKGETNDRTNK